MSADEGVLPAVILAGGVGSRLGTLTVDLPKPLVPVCGRPFLDWQLSWLAKSGVHEALLLVSYLSEKTMAFVGDGRHWGLRVTYSIEPSPMGTGGALKLAAAALPDTFLLVYGDSYLPIDYSAFSRAFLVSKADAVMVLHADANNVTGVARNVAVSKEGTVARYRKGTADAMTHIDAGVVGLRASVVPLLPDGASSLEDDLYPALARAGRLLAYPTDQRFYDMGTPAGLAELERLLCA